MIKRTIALAALAAALTGPATADEALTTFKVMAPDTALALAKATLESCREEGYQVAVAVVDRFGVTQVVIRDTLAGPHTPETARRKAWTAVSFRTDTEELVDVTQSGARMSGIRHLDNVLVLGGGVQVTAAGSVVGGVGVSGAPGGDLDDACARAGIAAVEDLLEF